MNSWKVSAELPSAFDIKISQGLLNSSNKELCGYGASKRRIVFVDSNVFHYFGAKIVRYFRENDIEAKVISIDISEET